VPDLRYHLISLISVFLALAIGILLGVAMADRGVISDQLQVEITKIRNQLSDQRGQIGKLQERTDQDNNMSEKMSDTMIANKLVGRNVALVAGPWAQNDAVQSVESALSDSGANITSNIRLSEPDPSEATTVEITGETTTTTESVYTDDTRRVMEDASNTGTPDTVVLVGGGRVPEGAPNGAGRILRDSETAMIETWLGNGLNVIGAEGSNAGRSEIQLFKDTGISSVDNADQPAGRAALVVIADTGADGSYGTKSSASDLFPPPG
jgi:hypothetical protein